MIVYRFPWHCHPNKDETWLAEQKKRMSKDELAREVLISYDYSVEGVVFSDFADCHVFKDDYEFDPFRPLVRAFDFGRTNSTLFAQLDNMDRLTVFREFVLSPTGEWGYKGDGTHDQGKLIQQISNQYDARSGFINVCDPAGNSPDHRTKTTDIKILESYEIRPLRFDRAMGIKDRKKDGISLIKKKLSERIGGVESVRISEQGCPILIDSFRSGYRYRQDKNGVIDEDVVDEEHPYEDVMDCLRYIILELFTPKAKQENKEAVIIPKGLKFRR